MTGCDLQSLLLVGGGNDERITERRDSLGQVDVKPVREMTRRLCENDLVIAAGVELGSNVVVGVGAESDPAPHLGTGGQSDWRKGLLEQLFTRASVMGRTVKSRVLGIRNQNKERGFARRCPRANRLDERGSRCDLIGDNENT